MPPEWTWDESLYAGSARYYSRGRVAYPREVADRLAGALHLDRSGRLLDVGCGPGSLTLLLSPHFAEAVGVDADADMLAEATTMAAQQGIDNVSWRHLRAEELPADLARFDVITFAQSFHWMDRARVAAAARALLTPTGSLVHVHANTHEGVDTGSVLPHPRPPQQDITALVQRYLGPERRAGQGVLVGGTPGGEDDFYRAAGFTGPERIEVASPAVTRTAEELAASVYSLSWSAPHLFGERLPAFDADLQALLHDASPSGVFSDQMPPVVLDVWR